MITPVIRSCPSPTRWKIGPATISNRPGEEQAPAGRLAAIGDQQDQPGDDQQPRAQRQSLARISRGERTASVCTGPGRGSPPRARHPRPAHPRRRRARRARRARYSVPARGASTHRQRREGTVALADGLVVWVEERGTGAALVAAGEDGIARDVTTLPPVERRAALPLGRRLRDDRFPPAPRLRGRQLPARRRGGPPAGRPHHRRGDAVRRLPGLAACQACSGEHLFTFALRGTVLGITGLCTRDAGVIDLATGETRRVPERIIAAAGRVRGHPARHEDTLIVERLAHRGDDHPASATSPSRRVRDQVAARRGRDARVGARTRSSTSWPPAPPSPRTVPRERERTYEVGPGGRPAAHAHGRGHRGLDVPARRPQGPRSADPVRLGVRRHAARLGGRAVRITRRPGVGPRHRPAAAGQ